ncbi:SICAvar, type I (fragment), partial [Plasmodium knowlesi strain H]
ENFWTANGDVGKLWTELSTAMKANNGNGTTECNQVDSGRTPTDPEKRACNHLTLGFNKLKDSSSNGGQYELLSNPLLRQTVGCFLLKEYAKKMKEDSKCVITSGLKKAFKKWNENITKTGCTGDSPCIECEWNDDSINNCPTATNGGTEEVEKKLNALENDMKTTATNTQNKINDTKTLCQQLQCAAPKWFQNQMINTAGTNSGTANKKTW